MRKPDARKEPMSAVGNYIDMLEKKIVELDKEIETLSGEVEQYKCQLKKERLTTAETFPVGDLMLIWCIWVSKLKGRRVK